MIRPRSDQNKLIEWLNALIVMAQWDKSLPSYFARLFKKPDQYQKALQLIHEAPQDGALPESQGDALSSREWRKLYQFATRAESLRKLFANGGDPFHGAHENEISLLAELSDLTTDSQTVFYSQNGTFQLVLETVRQRPEIDTASLITDGLNKFYTLFDTDKAVAEDLYKLACTNDWHVVLASLYDARDYTTEESAKQSLEQWNRSLISTELREILLRPTKLYRVPQKLIKLAWERSSLFEDALNSIEPNNRLSGFELRQQVSNVAYLLFVKETKDEIEEIESDLQLMAVVARHYISVRKFVKLDGLVAAWPKIASLAMANFRNLEYVEDFFVEKKQRPTPEELEKRDARELYDRCAKDPTVIRFFRLRPYFKEIDEDELRRYRPLAPVTISDPAQPPAPTIITPPAVERGIETPATFEAGTPVRVCELVIRPVEPVNLITDETVYEITLLGPGRHAAEGKATFSIRKLLDRLLINLGVHQEESLQSIMNSVFSGPNPEETLIRGGAQLLRTFITETGFEERLGEAFRGEGPVRLVIASDFREVHYLPWEWLPRPGYAELLLSNPRFSLVRATAERKVAARAPINSPVVILGVFPNTPTGTREISESSIKALEILMNQGPSYVPLVKHNASVIRLTDELEKLHPPIVHFEGYVNFLSDADENVAFVLSSLTALTESVHWSRFVTLLSGNEVQLFVAGRNDSSRIVGNAGVAMSHRLVASSIPAVLAPIRAIDDATATSLTTEFYRSFLAGNNIEQALYIARRKVASRGGDWTPFALFADPIALEEFQPLPPTP